MIFNWVELSLSVHLGKVSGFSALEKCWITSHLIRKKCCKIGIRSRWACIVKWTVFVPVLVQCIQSWPNSCCRQCPLGDFHGGSENKNIRGVISNWCLRISLWLTKYNQPMRALHQYEISLNLVYLLKLSLLVAKTLNSLYPTTWKLKNKIKFEQK